MTFTERRPAGIDAEVQRLTDELRQSEARFRDVIEQNADAIVVVDTEGVIRFANHEACRLFGADRAELIGGSFGFPLVAGETTELDLVRDGAPLTVEMRVVDSHWEGSSACIATLRNITERKRDEQQARELIREQTARQTAEEAAAKFRFLAESSALLSSSLDQSQTFSELARLCVSEIADWVVVYVCEEPGLRRVEAMHRDPALAETMRALRDSKVPPEHTTPIADLVRSRKPQLFARLDERARAEMILNESHRALINRLGMESLMLVPMVARQRLLGALSLVSARGHFGDEDLQLATDLASRAALAIDNARLYEDARQANQAKTDLLAIISHDLRTPLNSILGYGQLMGMGIPEQLPPAALQQLERMMTSARHQLYLIDELLHYARLDAGHEEIELINVDVRAVLDDAAKLIEPVAQEKGLRVELVLPPEPLIVHTDADKVRQVILNLLSNAVRYTQAGSIRLEAQRSNGEVRLCVHDTGVGIAEEHLPHVFEPFWQVDRSQRAHGGGTGLGLAVVKQVVELLGGRVAVRSIIGDGSTFEVLLPVAEDVELENLKTG